jgi:hypothetical protein
MSNLFTEAKNFLNGNNLTWYVKDVYSKSEEYYLQTEVHQGCYMVGIHFVRNTYKITAAIVLGTHVFSQMNQITDYCEFLTRIGGLVDSYNNRNEVDLNG